ncbi:MAG: glycosyltransferase family 4 protein [Acidimicrobiales bacterium]
MTTSLLVTNDFPPKVGGIQSYLWELWQRLDPTTTAVLTASSHPGHHQFDAEQAQRGLRITRVRSRILFFPTPWALRRIRQACAEVKPDLVLLDPVWPLGLLGRRLGVPYGVILHGAELAIPARLPVLRRQVGAVLRDAALVVSAGGYPIREAERVSGGPLRQAVEVPPGVDSSRYSHLEGDQRDQVRRRLGIPEGALAVASVSRLVPRKGMDILIRAVAGLHHDHPALFLAIAGAGRDARRLGRIIKRTGAPAVLLGRIAEADKAALLGASDVFVMVCRNRWGGLEQEGFGIVFLEAAAAGVPQVAGDSGGAAEAVLDGETGRVVGKPSDVAGVAVALGELLADEPLRRTMGRAARTRAETCFDYAILAPRLAEALGRVGG